MTLEQPTIKAKNARDYSTRHGQPILLIVIHATAGTNSLGWLSGNPNGTSIHVLIEKDGDCWRMVPDHLAAHHVGYSEYTHNGVVYGRNKKFSCNDISLGIELENLNNGKDPYPVEQLKACAWWIAHWRKLHPNTRIVMHRDIDTQGKTDARGLEIDDILQYLECEDEPTPPASTPAITGNSTIMAAPRGSEQQAVAYTMRRKPKVYTEYDVKLIASHYWQTAASVGIDPLIAWAQMIHETGALTSWWSQRPRRNPCGLGVTGETSRARTRPGADWVKDLNSGLWKRGYAFSDWSIAVKAHLGHLLAYAVPPDKMTDAQKAVVALDPRANALPGWWRGASPTLNGLNGKWAVPGGNYSDKIAEIAEAIKAS